MSQSSSPFHLDQHALQRLKEMGVPETEDSGKYDYKKVGDSYGTFKTTKFSYR